LKISIAEPVSQLRSIKIVENGEELVDFMAGCSTLIFDRARFNYRRETVVRATVAEMLCQASRSLPAEVRLGVVEGWRAPHIQRRMYLAIWRRFKEMHPDWSDVTLKRVVNRYSAPMDLRVPPPHTTGGAVDVLLLAPDGTMLDHTSPYEAFDPRSAAFAAPGLSDTARRTRDTLAAALLSAGLTNYPSEFWHWSYGDQGWAYRGEHPNALYGAVAPHNYCPDPAEDIDAPLEQIEEA
jgi:D-alanyl-D-alanine dipeptidase